jgi:hypothetical protein
VPDNVDLNVPDVVHADVHEDKKGKKKGKRGNVSIRDVLDKKDGDEVWVVIKGDVYESVLSNSP